MSDDLSLQQTCNKPSSFTPCCDFTPCCKSFLKPKKNVFMYFVTDVFNSVGNGDGILVSNGSQVAERLGNRASNLKVRGFDSRPSI